jgi:hypothetical protein
VNLEHSHRVLGNASNAARRGKKVRCREVGSPGEWRVFESVSEAARELGISPRTDSRACSRLTRALRLNCGGKQRDRTGSILD